LVYTAVTGSKDIKDGGHGSDGFGSANHPKFIFEGMFALDQFRTTSKGAYHVCCWIMTGHHPGGANHCRQPKLGYPPC
jgi:hypothetical protein